jgi:hypothetical protein
MVDKRILGMAAGAAASLLAVPSAAQDAFVEPVAGITPPPSALEGARSRAAIVQSAARGSTAEIEQNGREQDAFVFQTGVRNTATIDFGAEDQNSAGNRAEIFQVGSGLNASINVDGSENNGGRGLNARTAETARGTVTVEPPRENGIVQTGLAHSADVDVTGDNNAFRISQTASLFRGRRNVAAIEQRGEENVAVQDQQGTRNRANLEQVGDGHTAKQVQKGTGLVSNIKQMEGPNGEPAFIVHRQIGVGEAAGGSVKDLGKIVQKGGPPLAITQQ